MERKELPPICTSRKRWGDRKCLDYCAGRENCPYARRLISEKNKTISESHNEEEQV